mgnify:FL=1
MENEYDVSISNCADEDNQPTYLHITEEQLALLRWLDRHCWLDLIEADMPPEQVDLVKREEKRY